MNLDELQSVQSRERQTDSLQQLRETFYQDAGEFVQQLRAERDRAAERAEDPFDAPEVNRLTDDIKTAEQTVEAIYERRVGKVVKMASLAAADMPTEEEGLTEEERDLFETLVAAIENNREHVLDVLAGEASSSPVSTGADQRSHERGEPDRPEASATDETAPTRAADSAGADERTVNAADERTVDAADVMGGDQPTSDPAGGTPDDQPNESTQNTPSGADSDSPSGRETPPEPSGPPEAGARDEPAPAPESGESDERAVPPEMAAGAGRGSERADGGPVADDAGTDDGPGPGQNAGATDRQTVKITEDVGSILGVDEREYDLSTDDVVQLPAENVAPLVEQDAAEPLE
ncbi:MAG: hypothetical protein ABEH35_07975 [Haloarculaceae archaeon]